MSVPTARSILSSQHAISGKRIHTILGRIPRIVLAELNTHCVFSRNTASSRAIPISRMIQNVIDDPFIPLVWGKNQKGMQATEECNELILVPGAEPFELTDARSFTNIEAWLAARDDAVEWANRFADAGYHKQIVNRLLEPWMWTYVLITSTQWSNFFALRDHKDAEPHIAMFARAARDAIENAAVQTLQPGEWHLPFAQAVGGPGIEDLIKLSVACCASTSYKTVDGFDMTLERAIELHDKLRTAELLHASPFEHQAQMDESYTARVLQTGAKPEFRTQIGPSTFIIENEYSRLETKWRHPELSGKFAPGFIQYRKTLPNECR